MDKKLMLDNGQKLTLGGTTFVFRGKFSLSIEDGNFVLTANPTETLPAQRTYKMISLLFPETQQKVMAIKYAREFSASGLLEAKNFVEGCRPDAVISEALNNKTNEELLAIQAVFRSYGYRLIVA